MTRRIASGRSGCSGGWRVRKPFDSWRYRVEPVPGGVRVIAATSGGGEPAVWFVPRVPRQ